MNIPRITIAGTNSGCGKTTVTIGIMSALVNRGLNVQPFKVGPDYIDPMFHTFITGNYSRNLDSWILEEETVRYLFLKNSRTSDIAVIEGVMGLYDGSGDHLESGSTAHVSGIIKSPVIIVVNGEGMAMSIVALIRGFIYFNQSVDIKGVIINNINSEANFRFLKEIIEGNTCIKAIGYLPTLMECKLESRHLGLVPGGEVEDLKKKADILSNQIEKTIDLDLLLEISRSAGELREISICSLMKGLDGTEDKTIRESNSIHVYDDLAERSIVPGIRIAVAMDKAFNFYYRDNLNLLEMLGAELVYFSLLNDAKFPDYIHGLYIGGGYPEIFAEGLQDNVSMRECVKTNILKGLPTYAECGGFMYMLGSITNSGGHSFKMAGVIPGSSMMTASLQRFGYVEIEIISDNIMSEAGSCIRGHEFHYSSANVDSSIPVCFLVKRGRNSSVWNCGFKIHNLLAGYPHIHFWSNIGFAEKFVKNCGQYKLYIDN